MEWQRFHNILRMLNWLVLLCLLSGKLFQHEPLLDRRSHPGGIDRDRKFQCPAAHGSQSVFP